MYVAVGNYIYYCNPNETGSRELFITVHATKDCSLTPEQQARIICAVLNGTATLK